MDLDVSTPSLQHWRLFDNIFPLRQCGSPRLGFMICSHSNAACQTVICWLTWDSRVTCDWPVFFHLQWRSHVVFLRAPALLFSFSSINLLLLLRNDAATLVLSRILKTFSYPCLQEVTERCCWRIPDCQMITVSKHSWYLIHVGMDGDFTSISLSFPLKCLYNSLSVVPWPPADWNWRYLRTLWTPPLERQVWIYPYYSLFVIHRWRFDLFRSTCASLRCLLGWTASTRSTWRSAWLRASAPKSRSSLLSTTRWKWNMPSSWWRAEGGSSYLLLCLLLFPCSTYSFITHFLKFLKPRVASFMSTKADNFSFFYIYISSYIHPKRQPEICLFFFYHIKLPF